MQESNLSRGTLHSSGDLMELRLLFLLLKLTLLLKLLKRKRIVVLINNALNFRQNI